MIGIDLLQFKFKSSSDAYSNFILLQNLLQAVFQRYLRPEKDYLSFSLPYNNGKRSLDLVSGGSSKLFVFTLFPIFIYNNNIYDNLLFASRFARTKLRRKCGLQALKH